MATQTCPKCGAVVPADEMRQHALEHRSGMHTATESRPADVVLLAEIADNVRTLATIAKLFVVLFALGVLLSVAAAAL